MQNKTLYAKLCQLTLLAVTTLGLVACNETTDIRTIKGGYHFKTSGQVTVHTSDTTSYARTLDAETGQLEVVSLHNGDSLLLTFNQTNGGVYNAKGETDGKAMRFEPYTRTIDIKVDKVRYDTVRVKMETAIGDVLLVDSIIETPYTSYETFDLQVNGRAEVYENTLIFYMDYEGQSQSSEKTIDGRNIQMLAKKN